MSELLTDGGHVANREAVLSESQKQASFPDTRITDDDQLEEVIVATLGTSASCIVVVSELRHFTELYNSNRLYYSLSSPLL